MGVDRPSVDTEPQDRGRLHILALILLAGLFDLNDFSSIYLESWRWWLFIDYTAVKFFRCWSRSG